MKFNLHPSTTLLKLTTNAYDIVTAIKNDKQPPAVVQLPEGQWILAWRDDLISRFKALNAEEGMLLDLVGQNVNFAVMCEMAAAMQEPDSAAARVAGHITNWLNSQLVSEISTK